MPEQESVDQIFLAVGGVVGAIFTGISTDALQNLQAACPSPIIRNCWTAILVVGICMVLASILYFSCTLTNDTCYTQYGLRRSTEFYLGGFIFLGIILIIATSLMYKEFGKLDPAQSNLCDSPKNKKYSIIVMVLSGILVLGSIVALGFVMRKSEDENEVEIVEEKKPFQPRGFWGAGQI